MIQQFQKSLRLKAAVALTCFALLPGAFAEQKSSKEIQLLSVDKIWDQAPHNAFTDLIQFKGEWFCTFREGSGHVSSSDLGNIRIIVSCDGKNWSSAALLTSEVADLRDPKLSITPDQRLMVTGGQTFYIQDAAGKTVTERQSKAWFSKDGREWSDGDEIGPKDLWMWRTTWHDGVAYNAGYEYTPDNAAVNLFRSEDGVDFEPWVAPLFDEGRPNETTLRFGQAGSALAFVRRDNYGASEISATAFLGLASPPYKDWRWLDLKRRVGGPNFIQLPDGRWIGSGRLYEGGAYTSLFWIDTENGSIEEILKFPSSGDCSYPGMVWHDGQLWVSYYSSHESKTSIYLAQVEIPLLTLSNWSSEGWRLWVDDENVAELTADAEKELHAPVPQEKVLNFDEPWEGIYSGYVTVIESPDLYQMYYRGMPRAKHDLDTEVTCYAYSKDGIHWTKPYLGLFEVNGSSNNNVILARHRGCHNFAPFLDTRPGVPANERYKAVGGTGAPGLIAFKSPDGIHWSEIQSDPVITEGAFDSQNVAFWSDSEERYICYFRVFRNGVRWVARSTSEDFIHWTDPVDLELEGGPAQHLYTNQLFPYPRNKNLYLGFPTRFMPGRRALSKSLTEELGTSTAFDFRNDCADILLVSTRGGTGFNREFMEAWIRPGLDPKNWTSRANYAAHTLLQTAPNELSIYVNHNLGYPSAHMQRYTLRPDGFVSINAGFSGGTVTTPARVLDGEGLWINYATSAAGSIWVEALDIDHQPIAGFTLQDSEEILGDELARRVNFKKPLSTLNSKLVRFRFHLKDADLYSFRIE